MRNADVHSTPPGKDRELPLRLVASKQELCIRWYAPVLSGSTSRLERFADTRTGIWPAFLPFSYGSESGAPWPGSFDCGQRPHNLRGQVELLPRCLPTVRRGKTSTRRIPVPRMQRNHSAARRAALSGNPGFPVGTFPRDTFAGDTSPPARRARNTSPIELVRRSRWSVESLHHKAACLTDSPRTPP